MWALDEQLSRLELRQKLDEQIAGIAEQIDRATFSERTLKLLDLDNLGVTREEIDAVMADLDRLAALTSDDPTERFRAGFDALNRAFLQNRIGAEVYADELARIRDELARGLGLDAVAQSPMDAYRRQIAQLDELRSHLTDDQYLRGVEQAQQRLREALDIRLPRNPMAEYEQAIDNLSQALAVGAIDWEQYAAGVRSAREALEAASRASRVQAPGRPGLIESGTAQQQRAQFERAAGLDRLRDEVPRRQLSVQEEMAASLDRIERNTGERITLNVTEI
jgi:hypothetical protein